jgi:hypothetical protein
MKTFKTHDGDELVTDNPAIIDFVEKCEDHGIEWRTYSGRGMFGRQTAGVTVSPRGDISLSELEDAGIRISGLTTDSMGIGTIYYVF